MRVIVFVLVFLFCGVSQVFAFGLTADDIYRDVMGIEPKKTKPQAVSSKTEEKSEKSSSDKPDGEIFFEKKTQKTKEFEPESQWSDVVAAVKKGNVSPFDLAEIRRLSEQDKPEALELLAWMYATGTGVRQNLPKSYIHYVRAARLGVASAAENARKVYQAMSPSQRAALPTF